MRSLSFLLLSLVFISIAHPAGLPQYVVSKDSESDTASSVHSFMLNAGLIFAKSDPKYAAILNVLEINSVFDLQKFTDGDLSGSNFQDIVVHGAFQYAQQNPKYAVEFEKLGVRDEPGLKRLLIVKGGVSGDFVYNLALEYARGNPRYTEWLNQLGIQDTSDIHDIMNGGLEGSNLQKLILSFGQPYLQLNPKFSQSASILSLLLGDSALYNLDSHSLFLGAFEGLPISEIKLIQKTKKLKVRTTDYRNFSLRN
ncbi:MAG: hypothetical protein R3A80_03415 [Bdellovibrionota bacterium]